MLRSLKSGDFTLKGLALGFAVCHHFSVPTAFHSWAHFLFFPSWAHALSSGLFTIKVTESFSSNFYKHKLKLLISFHTLS